MTLTVEQLQAAYKELSSAGATGSLFFLLRTKKSYEDIGYSTVKSKIAVELTKGFREALAKAIKNLIEDEELEITEYDPAYVSDRHSVEYISVNEIPRWGTIAGELSQKIAPDEVEYDKKFFKSLWAYCIRIQTAGSTFLYFRKYSQSKVLQLGGPLSFYFSKGTFSHLEGDVFSFDEGVDCFVVGDQMGILNKNAFEQIFSYFEKYEGLAQSTLDVVKAANVLVGYEELQAACKSDSRKLKKLADIGRYVDIKKLDFDRLKTISSEWAVNVDIDEQTKKITVERRKIWGLLKLLSDDLLQSPLTNNKYVVPSKKRP